MDKVNRIFVSEAGDLFDSVKLWLRYWEQNEEERTRLCDGMLQTEDATDRRFYRRDCILDIVYKNESEYL